MRRYLRSTFYFACSSIPCSLFNGGRDEVRRNVFGGSRLLQASASSSRDSICLPYKENVTSRCLEVEIINVLRLGERERATNLLSDLVSKNWSTKAQNLSYILDYCARTPDPLFAMETWRLMEENKMEVNKQCWIHIIQALSSGGHLKEAFNLLDSLGATDRSTIQMYNLYLKRCAQSKNSAQANSCLQLMEDHFIGKSEVTYLQLLKLAVRQSNRFLAHDTWKEFNKFYEPSFISLHKFIWSFSKLRDLESACSALKQLVALAVQETAFAWLSSSRRYRSWLDIPIPPKNELACKMSTAKDHKCFLISKIEDNTTKLGGDLVENNLASSSDWNEEKYPANIPSCATNTADITFTEAHGISLKKVTDHRNACHSTVSYAIRSRVRKILRLSFNTLIHACVKSGECSLAEQLFQQMLDLGVEPSSQTYDGLIQAIISKRGVEYGIDVFKGMKKRNLKPCNTTLAALSIGYSKALDLDLAEAFINQIPGASPKLIHPFNALLSACNILDQPECAVRFFSKMKKMNVKPDIKTYELLFCLFGHVNAPYEEGNIFSQEVLRKRVRIIEMDMFRNGVEHNSFTLENLIRGFGFEGMTDELLQYLCIAENMFTNTYPGTITYNVVLHALVLARDSNAAINVLKKMIAYAVPLDAATYNIMIDCCSISSCFKTAYALLSLMLRSGFTPDACTYTALLKILVSNEKLDEALKLFNQFFKEGLEADVLVFNTILEKASDKGHLDIIELIIERMHQEKVQPDPTTCYYAYAAYSYCGCYNTAMEALQILSMRMISENDSTLQEKKATYEYLVYSEDPEVESWIIKIFSVANENLGAALLNLRWCAISGHHISWSPEDSPWAKRLSARHAYLKWAN